MLWPGDCAAAIVRAHRHGMRVLIVQLRWSGLLRASLAQLGVLVAHLDQRGVSGAWSTVIRGGRGLRVRLQGRWERWWWGGGEGEHTEQVGQVPREECLSGCTWAA